MTIVICDLVTIFPGICSEVISFDCGLSNSFCPNTTINMLCRTQYAVLTWELNGYSDIIFTALDTVGTMIARGPYTAELLTQQFGNTQSKLTFLAEKSVSGQSISCVDKADNDFKVCSLNLSGLIIIYIHGW